LRGGSGPGCGCAHAAHSATASARAVRDGEGGVRIAGTGRALRRATPVPRAPRRSRSVFRGAGAAECTEACERYTGPDGAGLATASTSRAVAWARWTRAATAVSGSSSRMSSSVAIEKRSPTTRVAAVAPYQRGTSASASSRPTASPAPSVNRCVSSVVTQSFSDGIERPVQLHRGDQSTCAVCASRAAYADGRNCRADGAR